MNYLDVAIIVPVFIYTIKGFSNGLVKEITGLLAIIIGLYIAINFSIFLEPRVESVFAIQEEYKPLVPILAFTLIFVFMLIIIKLIGYVIDRIAGILALGIISKIFGGLFGAAKTIVLISFILLLENKINILPQNTKSNSVLLPYTQRVTEIIIPEINKHKEKTKEIRKEIEKTKEKIQKRL